MTNLQIPSHTRVHFISVFKLLNFSRFSRFYHHFFFTYVDLFIRTSGEYRISNFLLWQAAYSEFYFTDVLWPDFDEHEFTDALIKYTNRDRRFGNAVDKVAQSKSVDKGANNSVREGTNA